MGFQKGKVKEPFDLRPPGDFDQQTGKCSLRRSSTSIFFTKFIVQGSEMCGNSNLLELNTHPSINASTLSHAENFSLSQKIGK